jgi:hypothetical protein
VPDFAVRTDRRRRVRVGWATGRWQRRPYVLRSPARQTVCLSNASGDGAASGSLRRAKLAARLARSVLRGPLGGGSFLQGLRQR